MVASPRPYRAPPWCPLSFPELEPLGWGDRWVALLAAASHPDAVPGRVVRHDGSKVLVAFPKQRSIPMAPGIEPPVVGDWVGTVDDMVVDVLPRHSLLRRRDAIVDGEQALAANVDVVFIVCGLDRPVRGGRLQRVAALAWDAGATPVVILTKSDLGDHVEGAVADVRDDLHEVDVLVVSVVDGSGLEDVRAAARDRTVVLLGESGAGKSTLVNALVDADVAATGAVREGDSKGRHTTTTRQLHPLPGGGVLLDSPGIRAVGLWVDPEAVDAVFPDIEALAEGCRFRDCAHGEEPGCAVIAAIGSEELPRERYEAWRSLRREAEAAAESAQDRHRKNKQFGRISREAQRMKKR
ncbi:MAG: GTPase EngC [Actinomycetia bacterium]|nr:GTPase EngC [Actinomycetes bacterium]